MRRQYVQHARSELAVLVLLAPDTRGQIHERREGAVRAAEGPDAGKFLRIDRGVLADEANGGRHVAGFLNGRLEPRSERIRIRIVVPPDTAVLEVDRLRKISGDGDRAVVRDVVQPLDDLRN